MNARQPLQNLRPASESAQLRELTTTDAVTVHESNNKKTHPGRLCYLGSTSEPWRTKTRSSKRSSGGRLCKPRSKSARSWVGIWLAGLPFSLIRTPSACTVPMTSKRLGSGLFASSRESSGDVIRVAFAPLVRTPFKVTSRVVMPRLFVCALLIRTFLVCTPVLNCGPKATKRFVDRPG